MAEGMMAADDSRSQPLRTFTPASLRNPENGMDIEPELASAELICERLTSINEALSDGDGGPAEVPAIKVVRDVVDEYIKRLREAQFTGDFTALAIKEHGSLMKVIRDGDVVLVIEERVEVVVGDDEEAAKIADELVDILAEIKARQRLVHNQATLIELQKSETGRHLAPQNRIDKLQRYNQIKDIAQELMGLIAENRGVTIGHLYTDNEFGVGPED